MHNAHCPRLVCIKKRAAQPDPLSIGTGIGCYSLGYAVIYACMHLLPWFRWLTTLWKTISFETLGQLVHRAGYAIRHYTMRCDAGDSRDDGARQQVLTAATIDQTCELRSHHTHSE